MGASPLALVLYRWRSQWPMRRWELERIRAWRHFPGRTVFFNLGFDFDPAWLLAIDPQLVVYDASALALRYQPLGWRTVGLAAEALSRTSAVRVAMPLDEMRDLAALRRFVEEARIDRVLTAAEPAVASALYPGMKGRVRRVLTAYVDERLAQAGRRLRRRPRKRPVTLGYRLWGAETDLGAIGQLKREIGERAATWAQARSVGCDIAVDGSRLLTGDAWLRFLSRCRVTVGAEGGGSVQDPQTGRRLDVAALSPRHLEAAAMGVIQVLAAGDYSGALVGGEHYLPVRHDLGDLSDALERALDEDCAERLTTTAYEQLIASGDLSWRKTIEDLAGELIA
jgi:hypothetical protein